jgi:hypothetical protein
MLSRLAALLALLFTAPNLFAQTALWNHVSSVYNPPQMPRAQLTQVELAAIRNLLRSPAQKYDWGCDDDRDADWINSAFFSSIALTTTHRTILVEGRPRCALGGTGGGGPMWVVELQGSRASVLASPKQDFSGWLYSVQPNPHRVYSDIVLGWHMSAFESNLSYFRFNGHFYALIGSAVLKSDDHERNTLVPNPPHHPLTNENSQSQPSAARQ